MRTMIRVESHYTDIRKRGAIMRNLYGLFFVLVIIAASWIGCAARKTETHVYRDSGEVEVTERTEVDRAW